MVGGRDVARLLAGTFLLAVTAGTAKADTRALSLYNTHTQERATVVFKRDGVYDQQGLQELNRLLRDWRRNEVTRMDPQLFDLIWEVYRRVGSHVPINVVCGYRSPATNNMLRERSRGVAKFSQHMLGKAMDFYMPDVPLATLRETGMKMQIGGVGFYPTSGSPFVHMDTGSVRAWPRMTREQLVRLFPDGKTAHLPADGEPLPGYQQALAESQARKDHGGGPVDSGSSGGGLLAALFGGGSSYSTASTPPAVAGEDEEETVSSAPRRQELRQGPLPGAKPTVVASAVEGTPPGIDEGPAPRQAAAPVPTAVARGSLVPMPVPSPAPARPAQVASAEPMPSRYGPTAAATTGSLPPGWVQGPSGHTAASAEPAPQPQQIAFTPGLVPMAAPLPTARPTRGGEMVAMAVEQPIVLPPGLALPKPRPGTPARVADASGADAAHAALSAFTGDDDREPVALGYASAAPNAPAAGEPTRTASLTAPPPTAATAHESRFSPNAAQPGKTDRVSATGRTDRATGERIYDPAAHAEGDAFAQMRHPDQNTLDQLFEKPRMAIAGGFTTAALGGMEADDRGFSGPAVVALPVVLTR